MPTPIKPRRGLDANRTSIVPAAGELIVTTDTKKLYLGDGTTAGGIELCVSQLFPAGTVMLFAQTNAPTGWTKLTTHNDKSLRVVSGSAGSGGAVDFSTVFGRSATDGYTLSTADIPAHTHGGGAGYSYGLSGDSYSGGFGGANTGSVGGGSAHSHSVDLRVKYVDVILATKD